jgi:hypothetical protein
MKRRGAAHPSIRKRPVAGVARARCLQDRFGPAGPVLLPHERDEIADPAMDEPQKEMRRAARDLANGLVDTEARAQALRIFERANRAGTAKPDSPNLRPRKPLASKK